MGCSSSVPCKSIAFSNFGVNGSPFTSSNLANPPVVQINQPLTVQFDASCINSWTVTITGPDGHQVLSRTAQTTPPPSSQPSAGYCVGVAGINPPITYTPTIPGVYTITLGLAGTAGGTSSGLTGKVNVVAPSASTISHPVSAPTGTPPPFSTSVSPPLTSGQRKLDQDPTSPNLWIWIIIIIIVLLLLWLLWRRSQQV